MSRAVPVKGLKELDDYLSHLPANMQKGAYRAGLVAAAAVVRDEARLRAPRESGQLARSIRSGSPRRNEDGTFSITVGPRGGAHSFLGLFHEFGVQPHYIARTGKGEGRVAVGKAKEGTGTVQTGVMKIGDDFVSGIISHPGFVPRPFLRPALDIRADDAVAAFAARIRAYLEAKTGFAAPLAEAA